MREWSSSIGEKKKNLIRALKDRKNLEGQREGKTILEIGNSEKRYKSRKMKMFRR